MLCVLLLLFKIVLFKDMKCDVRCALLVKKSIYQITSSYSIKFVCWGFFNDSKQLWISNESVSFYRIFGNCNRKRGTKILSWQIAIECCQESCCSLKSVVSWNAAGFDSIRFVSFRFVSIVVYLSKLPSL